jgi:dipeptidyl aminopeptidase/acylaminoacyl peptidase
MHSRGLACFLCLLLTLPSVPLTGQQQSGAKFALTVDNIMRGPGLYGYPPQDVRWSGDSQRIYFRWKKHDEPVTKELSTYVVSRDGTGLRKLNEEEQKDAPPLSADSAQGGRPREGLPISGDDTRDWKLSVYSVDGDLYLYNQLTSRRHVLSRTGDREQDPRFTRDEKRITYSRGNNLYVLSPADGSTEQLTDIRSGEEPAAGAGAAARAGGRAARGAQQDDEERKGTESQEFLKKEERDLLAVVREQAKKREEDRARRKKENPRKPFRINQRQAVTSLHLSPDETYVLALITETSTDAKTAVVPNFVTDTGYTTEITTRTKVGDVPPNTRIAFLDVKTGESKWLDPGIKDGDKDREIRLGRPMWSDDGSKLAVVGRSADNKDQWLFAVDPSSAKVRVITSMHDDAWVGGPAANAFGWLADNQRLYFTAERDGWSHLYTVKFEGGEPKQLTSGKWEVREVKLTPDRSQFVITTSEVHPGEDHLYLMGVDGGARRKITHIPGGHDAVLSPDGATIASVFSYTNKPPELLLLNAKNPSAKPIQVTQSPAPDFAAFPWLDVPIVEIPARDGAKLPARMYKGQNFRSGGPLVVFVHGAGYLQNVHHRWSTYAREYMFHHLLMERGYMVLDVDYRASAGYGRDWRTGIYRHMGGKDLDDQVDAVKWAIAQHGVHPKRVGIYGGSYGGFITLMALFTQPDMFAAGAALRPVTDWAHYNHGYTSNILNIPQKDAEAYRRSSPIYHAQGLKGALLICHGMVDINVHFQDTVRLVQRLIELRKENWELAAFPVEDHAFIQPTSWADEYKRILKLFETNLGSQR